MGLFAEALGKNNMLGKVESLNGWNDKHNPYIPPLSKKTPKTKTKTKQNKTKQSNKLNMNGR